MAQYAYEQALCAGLTAAGDMDLEYVTVYQTGYYPKDRLICRKKRDTDDPFAMLGFVNLPFLREISYFISAWGALSRWAVKHRKEKNKCIYTSTHFTPVSLAIVWFTRLFGIKRVVTLTDLAQCHFSKERIRQMPAYKRAVMAPYLALTGHLQRSYDGYVLFTQAMNEIVNPRGKPYCVVEGIYNPEGLSTHPVQKHNAIAYAGTLDQSLGIETILKSHGALEGDTQLWLMGQGDAVQQIREQASHDPRVNYLGFLPRPQVFERLKSARLLVLLRDPEDGYTRYSFPSKLLEYMASQTPVFTTCLSGIPREYDPYLYITKGRTPQEIAADLRAVLQKPDGELADKGRAASAFILEQKTAAVQSEKVRHFLLTITGKNHARNGREYK